jgi:small multidrug resistance pump
MGVGVAYAVWGACGVALTALLSAVFFDEHLSVVTALGILVIIAGVVTVHAGGQRASSPDAIGLQDERT